MGNKQKQLEKLRKKIINRVNKDVWFYPEYEGIKGYLGTQNLVFIGPNPSYNKFPTRHTNFFYEQLKINRFKNAHLTDLVKIRTFNKDSENILNDKKVINKQLEFLREEFDIIKPKLIVILGACTGWKGKKIKEILEENFRNIRNINIYHYTYVVRFFKKDEFIQQMKNVKKIV